MRGQPGSDDLRVLVYMDEVYGYVPPTAMPPSKKPILTILKQARAYGVGVVLSTQNPVDIDYKAISNAGTWMIGRLQTERDKARLLDGMQRSDGGADIAELATTISSLDKREFVLHSTRSTPRRFSTRWAMSYLPGPLSRSQIGELMADAGIAAASSSAASAPVDLRDAPPKSSEPALADDETTVAPTVHRSIEVRHLRRDAPWADDAGADPTSNRLVAALAVRMHLLFDDTKADLRHETEWEAIVRIDGGRIDPDDSLLIDFDDRDFTDTEPPGAIFVLPEPKLDTTPFFTKAKAAFKDHLYRSEVLELHANPTLKLYSRVGEDLETFRRRCERLADERADEDLAELTAAFRRAEDRAEGNVAKLEDRIRELQYDEEASRSNTIAGVALDVLGGLLGGRRRGRSIGRSVLSQRKTAGKARERLATAENRYRDAMDDLDLLRREYEEDEIEIRLDWQATAHEIGTHQVGLEKTDISVDDIALVWLPVRRSAGQD